MAAGTIRARLAFGERAGLDDGAGFSGRGRDRAAHPTAMLNDDEKAVLSRTWAEVLPNAEAFADLFVERLLALRPSYAALFLTTDLPARKTEFLRAIGFLVRTLDWPEAEWLDAAPVENDVIFAAFAVVESGEGLAGIAPETYPLLGQALTWALESTLGARFDDVARAVWGRVTTSMVTALRLGATRAEDAATTRRQPDPELELSSDTQRFPLSFSEGGPPSHVGQGRRIVSN